MKRILLLGSALFVVLAALIFQVACSSSNNPVSSPPISGGGGGGTANVMVSIVGINGSNSFSPNPVTVPSGQTVGWHNADPVNTHHIVADDGSFDAGSIPPGTSGALVMPHSGAVPYHCANHPSMIGTINGSQTGSPGGPGY